MTQLDLATRVSGDLESLDAFARELGGGAPGGGGGQGILPRRINARESGGERDLAKLVLSLVDLLRQLMERQALRRVNAGSLSDDEVERMGQTFMKLDRRMTELCAAFGLQPDELTLGLGPIHGMDEERTA